MNTHLSRASQVLALLFLAAASALAADHNDIFLLTSTNNASGNQVVVFRLNTVGTASLNFVSALPTGGNGGASGNAGAVQSAIPSEPSSTTVPIPSLAWFATNIRFVSPEPSLWRMIAGSRSRSH